MRSSGVAPSNYTLSILVKLMGRSQRLKRAFSMVDEFRLTYGLHPNIQVYTCLMQACLQNKQVSKALEVHDEMVRELKHPLDEKAFSVLLGGCIKAWAMEEAVRVARCAYGLPGHGLVEADTNWGTPAGVDQRLLHELAMKLRQASVDASLMKSFEEVQEVARTRPPSSAGSWSRGGKSDGKGEKGGFDGRGGKGSFSGGPKGSKGNWNSGKAAGKGAGKAAAKSSGKGSRPGNGRW